MKTIVQALLTVALMVLVVELLTAAKPGDGLIAYPKDTKWVFIRGEETLFSRDAKGFTRAPKQGPGWLRYHTAEVNGNPAFALKPYHYVHVADRDNAVIMPVDQAWLDEFGQ